MGAYGDHAKDDTVIPIAVTLRGYMTALIHKLIDNEVVGIPCQRVSVSQNLIIVQVDRNNTDLDMIMTKINHRLVGTTY